MTLKFGLALPYNEARLVAQLSKLAEETGWDGIFLGDYIWCEDPMIALAAAAMVTSRIRLGTMIIPAPLRSPWKLASESVALDRLSNGRLILGLGTGATWMGWQSFPDVATDHRARAEMLDETIDILTQLYQRKQFDYDGKHYHLKLTLMDEQHYPAKPIQQPRVPLWVPAVWPLKQTLQRALKCDGMFLEKRSADGQPADVTPADVKAMKAFVNEHRTLAAPFEIVASGKTVGLTAAQQREAIIPWSEAGATWWIEGLWGESEAAITEHIRQGPPRLE